MPGAVVTSLLTTARGLGLGFVDLSRKESRIPRKIRKNITATIVAVVKALFLVNFIISTCTVCSYGDNYWIFLL